MGKVRLGSAAADLHDFRDSHLLLASASFLMDLGLRQQHPVPSKFHDRHEAAVD